MKKLLLLLVAILAVGCSADPINEDIQVIDGNPTEVKIKGSSITSKGVERPHLYDVKIDGGTYQLSELYEYSHRSENDTNIYYFFNHATDGNIQFSINYHKDSKLYYTYLTIDKYNNGVIGISHDLQSAINVIFGG